MKLYLIYQDMNTGYNRYKKAIVTAENKEEAIMIHPDSSWKDKSIREDDFDWWEEYLNENGEPLTGDYRHSWTHPYYVSVELIGTAKPGTKKGVILASFNAG